MRIIRINNFRMNNFRMNNTRNQYHLNDICPISSNIDPIDRNCKFFFQFDHLMLTRCTQLTSVTSA